MALYLAIVSFSLNNLQVICCIESSCLWHCANCLILIILFVFFESFLKKKEKDIRFTIRVTLNIKRNIFVSFQIFSFTRKRWFQITLMVSPCWHKNICAFWKFNWNEICAYVLHMCIVIKNGDIIWKQRRYCVIFSWTWSFWGSSRIGTTSEQRKWLLAVRIFNWIWLWCRFAHFLFLSLWCKHFWGSRKDQSR